MKITTGVFLIVLAFFLHSCCWSTKEDRLGNNFILSEYDNVDRRILYSEEMCSVSGIEIVPMTVTEYANDSKWIIAKSRTSKYGTDYKYWIINKEFKVQTNNNDSSFNTIKSHVYGPFDSTTFINNLRAYKINLLLKKI